MKCVFLHDVALSLTGENAACGLNGCILFIIFCFPNQSHLSVFPSLDTVPARQDKEVGDLFPNMMS